MKRKINGIRYIKCGDVFVPESLVAEPGVIMKSPDDMKRVFPHLPFESQEVVGVITLNGRNEIIKQHEVTRGLVNQSQIHPREVFRRAIEDNAVSIIMVHNHPSGSMDISPADMGTTKRFHEAGKLLGIELLDHIVMTRNGNVSIRDKAPWFFES